MKLTGTFTIEAKLSLPVDGLEPFGTELRRAVDEVCRRYTADNTPNGIVIRWELIYHQAGIDAYLPNEEEGTAVILGVDGLMGG